MRMRIHEENGCGKMMNDTVSDARRRIEEDECFAKLECVKGLGFDSDGERHPQSYHVALWRLMTEKAWPSMEGPII